MFYNFDSLLHYDLDTFRVKYVEYDEIWRNIIMKKSFHITLNDPMVPSVKLRLLRL